MPLTTVDATLSTFESVFQRFKSENAGTKKFLLFLADKDPSTNLSWCPAEPIIYQKLSASSSDVTLIRAYVGDRPTWRNPAHPWRKDPIFKLTGVPTFIRWENNSICGRLEDYEAHVEKKMEALLSN